MTDKPPTYIPALKTINEMLIEKSLKENDKLQNSFQEFVKEFRLAVKDYREWV